MRHRVPTHWAGMDDIDVVLVDSDPDASFTLEIILAGDMRFTITVCDNASQALRAMQIAAPDLLMTQLHLPDMDGLHLASLARRHRPSLPVLILTSDPMIGETVRILESEHTFFLPEPLTAQRVISAVDNALAHRQPACSLHPLTDVPAARSLAR